MKRTKGLTAFVSILACLFIYQNCGGYNAMAPVDDTQTGSNTPIEKLDVRVLELKRFVNDTGEFFQIARVEITETSMYMVVDESDICQRSFQLGQSEQQQVVDLFKTLSYRNKGSGFPSKSHLVSELIVEDRDGNKKEANVLVKTDDELSLAPDAEILNQSTELVALLDELIGKTYATDQSSCTSQNEIPRFVEYVWTDVVNNNSVVTEAFLFESQSDGNVIFLSGPNATTTCYEAHMLDMHERALVIKSLSRVVLDNNTATPVNTNGVRYIDYHFASDSNQQGQRYYIDGTMAPANSQILNNGEVITDMVLLALTKARARYAAAGLTPTTLNSCVFNN